jgi:hypothetical protein
MPAKPFERLGSDYCSVGADMAYYEKLFKLGETIYRPYLEGISDAAYSDEIRATFEDLEGSFTGASRSAKSVKKVHSRLCALVYAAWANNSCSRWAKIFSAYLPESPRL